MPSPPDPETLPMIASALATCAFLVVLLHDISQRADSGWNRWRQRRRLLRMARTPLRDHPQGLVAVCGRVVAATSALPAPVSGEPSIAHATSVDVETMYPMADSPSWEEQKALQFCSDFLVDDGTGRALVRGEGARLLLDVSTYLPEERRILDRVAALLSPRGVPETHLEQRSVRVREGVLAEGDQVIVFGFASSTADSYRGLPSVLTLSAPAGESLVVLQLDPRRRSSNRARG